VDTYDWQGPSTGRMIQRIVRGDRMTPPLRAGGNVLMHGHGAHTSEGLNRIITAIRARGLTLEPLRTSG
jgi:hypothetical protein